MQYNFKYKYIDKIQIQIQIKIARMTAVRGGIGWVGLTSLSLQWFPLIRVPPYDHKGSPL